MSWRRTRTPGNSTADKVLPLLLSRSSPVSPCSSSTTNVACQLATVRRRYGGPASFNYGGRPVCLPMIFIALDLGLHSLFGQGGSARVPRVPRVHFCTFGRN